MRGDPGFKNREVPMAIVLDERRHAIRPEFRLDELTGTLRFRLMHAMPWLLGLATVILGFLIGRRLLPEAGTAAGLLAAIFIMLSPAHRAFATDIMLESMGAALTLLCLLRYLIAVQENHPARGRWLGLSLTLLF